MHCALSDEYESSSRSLIKFIIQFGCKEGSRYGREISSSRRNSNPSRFYLTFSCAILPLGYKNKVRIQYQDSLKRMCKEVMPSYGEDKFLSVLNAFESVYVFRIYECCLNLGADMYFLRIPHEYASLFPKRYRR